MELDRALVGLATQRDPCAGRVAQVQKILISAEE
jgi:hypothetical protein